MKLWQRIHHEQRGQAFIELAVIVMLFAFFITGMHQIVLLTAGRIQCEQAARRGAWLSGVFNHTEFESHKNELRALYPWFDDCTLEGQNRDKGYTFSIHGRVRPVGFFRWLRPEGFEIKAHNAVLAYAPKPAMASLQDATLENLMKLFSPADH